MKLLLPVTALVFAAGSACCCGALTDALKQNGIDTPAADQRVKVSLPANELVRIVEVSSEDAYFSSKDTLVGRACTTDEATTINGDGWHGGGAHCGTDSYYFYKVAYQDMGPAPVTAATTPTGTVVPAIPGLRATAPIPSGTRVKLLDIHSEDAYYADRSTMLGKLCTFAETSSFKDVEWHGGSVNCDDGSNYYFYKAAFEVQGAAAVPVAASTVSAPSTSGLALHALPNGERVKIMDVASDDAYYADRAGIIGKTCTLGETSTFRDGSWHGGSVACDDGSSYYFYKAAYKDLGAGKVAAPVAAAPANDGRIEHAVPNGARVKIVDVATDDAYYSDRASIIGKTCTLGETSTYREGGWQGGQIGCDDGSSYYFFKAAYVSAGGGRAGGGGADGRVKHRLPSGAKVTIVDVAPDDAYYSDRASIIGKSCTLDEASSYKEDGAWHGGQMHCDDGSSYYFYKAAYKVR